MIDINKTRMIELPCGEEIVTIRREVEWAGQKRLTGTRVLQF